MNLPARCARCAESDWVVVEIRDNTGVERCACPRGRLLAELDSNRNQPRADVPGIGELAAMAAVERLSITMRMVPSGEAAHMLIAEELAKFVCDPAGLAWLLDAAPIVFRNEWPGIGELRALYCRVNRPKDGQEADSGLFGAESWPAIPGVAPVRQIEAPPKRGAIPSGDAQMVEAVSSLARVKSMPPIGGRLAPPEYLIPAGER